jgi:hypothetical protein
MRFYTFFGEIFMGFFFVLFLYGTNLKCLIYNNYNVHSSFFLIRCLRANKYDSVQVASVSAEL